MSACLDPEIMMEALEKDAPSIDGHLASCAICRERLERAQAMDQLLRREASLPAAVPIQPHSPRFGWVGPAAALLFFSFILWWTVRTNPPQPTPQTPGRQGERDVSECAQDSKEEKEIGEESEGQDLVFIGKFGDQTLEGRAPAKLIVHPVGSFKTRLTLYAKDGPPGHHLPIAYIEAWAPVYEVRGTLRKATWTYYEPDDTVPRMEVVGTYWLLDNLSYRRLDETLLAPHFLRKPEEDFESLRKACLDAGLPGRERAAVIKKLGGYLKEAVPVLLQIIDHEIPERGGDSAAYAFGAVYHVLRILGTDDALEGAVRCMTKVLDCPIGQETKWGYILKTPPVIFARLVPDFTKYLQGKPGSEGWSLRHRALRKFAHDMHGYAGIQLPEGSSPEEDHLYGPQGTDLEKVGRFYEQWWARSKGLVTEWMRDGSAPKGLSK